MFAAVIFAMWFAQADSQTAGSQALDRGDYAAAAQIFGKAAAADPKDYYALFNLSLAETGLKKDESAAGHLRQVLVLKPGLYEAETNLAILDLRDGKPGDAIPLLRDMDRQKPGQARTERYLAEALLASRDFSGAAEMYSRLLAANPKSAESEAGLGKSLEVQGKLEEAEAHLERAAQADAHYKPDLLRLADEFMKAGRREDAIPLLQQFPNDPQARLALATVYLDDNKPDLAEPLLAQALADNPADYDVRMALGRIARDRKNYAAAAEQFAAATKLKPDSVEAWNEAAAALMLSNQYAASLAALDQIRRMGAEKAGDVYLRALILDKLHQPKPALTNYQKFLQMSHGEHPDQEFLARHRSITLEKEAGR